MPIQILPPQLANQIAAGEVVERPASVVKELVENSLDAGATRIDIDIAKGGAKCIRIRDNGAGIAQEELAMALARHATSKIATLDDLEAIMSLGFRGEALASISSVSRLTLTSRTADQNEAWQAYAEGREMAVTVRPAAHPVGTTLEVLDLFYNTPARRRFMRTEKTEFTHIDEVIRRIALARFDVAISLSHNDKLMRQYRPASDESQQLRRLGSICGATFMEQALQIDWQHGDLHLKGWVSGPAGSRQPGELQYCYVNGRMMRDKLINHAIRQAWQTYQGDEQLPAWVLYLQIDPHQVDVNVHPAKHEVRFHQSRLVHDFIYQGVLSVLQASSQPALAIAPQDERFSPAVKTSENQNRASAGENQFVTPRAAEKPGAADGWQTKENSYSRREGTAYQQLIKTPVPQAREPAPARRPSPAPDNPIAAHSQSFGRVLTVLHQRYALLEKADALFLLALPVADRWLRHAQLAPDDEGLKAQPLLIPVRLKLEKSEQQAAQRFNPLLQTMGITLQAETQPVTLSAVPLPLRTQNLQNLIPDLLGYLAQQQGSSPDQLAQWLSRHMDEEDKHWNHAQAVHLLAELERLCPTLITSPPSGLLQAVDIQQATDALTHE